MTAAPALRRGVPARPGLQARLHLHALPGGRAGNPDDVEANPRRRRRRKKNRHRNSSSNPQPVTWIMLAGGAAIVTGVGIGYLMRRRRAAPPEIPGEVPGEVPGGGGGGGGAAPKPAACVGSPGYVWSHASRFPNERSFCLEFRNLGYNTGQCEAADYKFYTAMSVTAVKRFQSDWNKVAQTINDTSPAPKYLKPDGCVGGNTINALVYAIGLQNTTGMTWQQIVAGS